MRSLKALRGLAALSSSTLIQCVESTARTLTTASGLKDVLKEKIPEQQVCIGDFPWSRKKLLLMDALTNATS